MDHDKEIIKLKNRILGYRNSHPNINWNALEEKLNSIKSRYIAGDDKFSLDTTRDKVLQTELGNFKSEISNLIDRTTNFDWEDTVEYKQPQSDLYFNTYEIKPADEDKNIDKVNRLKALLKKSKKYYKSLIFLLIILIIILIIIIIIIIYITESGGKVSYLWKK
jgi:hypothetical protein